VNFEGSWNILWNEMTEDESMAFLSAPPSNKASITSNGSSLFLHDSCGIVKIGTGFLSETQDFYTVQGKIYAREANWKPDEKGWIACVQDKLYYRSPSIEPATLIVLGASTLKVRRHPNSLPLFLSLSLFFFFALPFILTNTYGTGS
jgi:hypothetical protein